MNVQAVPLALGLGWPEFLIIFAVVVLLFGAAKLPDLARNSGRALRIFKSETKGLLDGDDDKRTPEQQEIDRANQAQASEADRKPSD